MDNKTHFPKLRAVLDKYDKAYIDSQYFNLSTSDFMAELTLALYDEINIYWLGRALTSLTDKDVPDCMKQAYLRELKKIK